MAERTMTDAALRKLVIDSANWGASYEYVSMLEDLELVDGEITQRLKTLLKGLMLLRY